MPHDAYPLPKVDQMTGKIFSHAVFSTPDLKSAYYQISIPDEDKAFTGFEACENLFQFRRILFGVTNDVLSS